MIVGDCKAIEAETPFGFDKDLVRLLVLVLVVFGGWCLGVLEQVVFFFLRVFYFLFLCDCGYWWIEW